MKRWEFVHNAGELPWQWKRIDGYAGTVQMSGQRFATFLQCIRDAERNGYMPECASGLAGTVPGASNNGNPDFPARLLGR
jgi:hypothetical protein